MVMVSFTIRGLKTEETGGGWTIRDHSWELCGGIWAMLRIDVVNNDK